MSKRRKPAVKQVAMPNRKKARSFMPWILLVLASAALLSTAALTLKESRHTSQVAILSPIVPTNLEALLKVPPDQLGRVDIGLMNLLCAEGLPGSEGLNVEKDLATIDLWAEMVKRATKEQHHLFEQKPGDYENSENNFKMFMLVETLQVQVGIHYNPDWLYISTNKDITRQQQYAPYHDSRNIFINGLLEQGLGTCANMAPLYVAIAHRCGYPVYLVRAHEHFFARWDDGKERFNCEGTNRGMVEPYRRPDEHYRKWPKPITDEEMRDGYYLRDMSPTALLAEFLFMRGDALWQQDFRTPGIECFMASYRLAPQFSTYRGRVVESLQMVNKRLQELDLPTVLASRTPHNQAEVLAEADDMGARHQQMFQLQQIKAQLAQLQPNHPSP